MASRGGWRGGRAPSVARRIQTTAADRKRLALEAVTILRERAFPGSGVGRDEDGKAYSPYSTKGPLYVSKKSPPRPADMPAPKGGKKPPRIKRAKDARTVRYDGGYSEYRAAIGRSSGANKNLVLTGQTARDLSYLRSTQRSVVIGFKRRRERARQLDARYKFMGFTRAELARLQRVWVAILRERSTR